jgi:hypothetical protein
VWLNVLRHGLMWRVRVFSSEDEARRVYEETYRPQLQQS